MPVQYQSRTLAKVVDARIDLMEADRDSETEILEDCPFCRSLDCDILFALGFTLIVICLLILIVGFWLKGVISYEDKIAECDYQFDSTVPKGHFNFPIVPTKPPPTSSSNHILTSFPDEIYSTALAEAEATPGLPQNVQCIYTFIARQGQRVKLEFEQFQLAGTADNCEIEYIDIYSELGDATSNLLEAALGGRYCGGVAPKIRISLKNVLILVFHSRVGAKRTEELLLKGRYSFISDQKYVAGVAMPHISICSYLIEYTSRKGKGVIFSPTYPGTYPSNIQCTYKIIGNSDQRIKLYFKDFDVYFGGEHCPYDVLTIYDGPDNSSPIIKKVCGLQQKLEVFSTSNSLLIEFNTTDPQRNDPRGYLIEYEFASRFVNVPNLIQHAVGVSHIRGTECDVRVQSNDESLHYIYSPNYPMMYPTNISCTYILDGLQGDQNLEKVVLTFEQLAVFSDGSGNNNALTTNSDPNNVNEVDCPSAFVGIAFKIPTIRQVLSSNDGASYDKTVCERPNPSSDLMGPYQSKSSRMVLTFESSDQPKNDGNNHLGYGFKAKVQFMTDFGVPGEAFGDSNKCLFRFKDQKGTFNSPRFPGNYPLDTTCTYLIEGNIGDQVIIYFEAFELFEEASKDICNDYVELYNILVDQNGNETAKLQEKFCWAMSPGPSMTQFGSHKMRVVFNSDLKGTANGFKAFYEIRKQFEEEIPSNQHKETRHCGERITSSLDKFSGTFHSPNFGVKYSKDTFCDWEIVVREGYQINLQPTTIEVEGVYGEDRVSCSTAVIKIVPNVEDPTSTVHVCGMFASKVKPILSKSNKMRISFYTSPEKVNGLKGFLYSWTEVKIIEKESECMGEHQYLCTYSKMCIAKALRCDSHHNCGHNDESDETHCHIKELATDTTTVVFAGIISGMILLFILAFFCFLFKKKIEKRHRHHKDPKALTTNGSRRRQPNKPRIPYRQQQPVGRIIVNNKDLDLTRYDHGEGGLISSPLTSRFVNHDATGVIPPSLAGSLGRPKPSINNHNNIIFMGSRRNETTFDV
uniref:CUB domain-containing protein n=1 Tax=Rhabditophanes sp. KR3021 TaxID=114890 RepID=A0AC35TUK3_9BILA